jgi:hypothetical protein
MLEAFKDWFHLHYQLLKDFVPSIVALLGLGLTAVIAIAGFKSFGRWKREKAAGHQWAAPASGQFETIRPRRRRGGITSINGHQAA